MLTGIFNYLNLLLLAYVFGAGMEMDAFFAAVTIPQIISAILLAILSATFIPVFIEARSKDETNAWKVASISINLLFLCLFVIAVIGSLFSKNVIALINPGFQEETSVIAVSLFRIMILSIIFSGTSILLTSVYFAKQRFFKASFASWMNSVIVFLFVLFLRSSLGVKSIIIGTLVGSIIQFLFLFPVFMKKGRYYFLFDFKKKEIVKLGRLIFPLLIGSIFYKTNTLVERLIASNLGDGKISYLGYAYKICIALIMVINQGISTVIFPRMSEYSAVGDLKSLKEILSKGMRALIIITTPVVFLIFLAKFELVRLILERGNFSPSATTAVGNTLIAYLGFFIVASISLPIVNTLYSLQETTKVAIVGVLGFILYVFLAFFLSGYFSYLGIALAVSIQYIINIIIFLSIVKNRLGGFKLSPIFRCMGKSVLAAGVSSLFILGTYNLVSGITKYPFDFIIQVIIGLALYLIVLIILKSEELKFIKLNFSFLKMNKIKIPHDEC